MKIHLIGRHTQNFFPDNIEIAKQTSDKIFSSEKDAYDFLCQVYDEALKENWKIVFQNSPVYLTIALSQFYAYVSLKPRSIGFVVGKQSTQSREPKTGYFQTSEPNVVCQAIMFANPKANCQIINEAEVKIEIQEPLVKFEFDKIIWL